MEKMFPKKPYAIIVDEAQFLTPKQVEELYLINEIAYKIAIGEPVTVPINGINFLLTEFGELFK